MTGVVKRIVAEFVRHNFDRNHTVCNSEIPCDVLVQVAADALFSILVWWFERNPNLARWRRMRRSRSAFASPAAAPVLHADHRRNSVCQHEFFPLGSRRSGAALFGARAAAVEDEAPPPIRPTVTAHSSDVGGKIFGQAPDPEKTHHSYIAPESVSWDFVPAGRDEVCGLTLSPAVVTNHERQKLRYIQYTDDTITA